MVRALLIEFDARTGKRAGDINPRDPNLFCRGWQNLESEPALEIRLVNDDRDLSRYEGVEGVTILDGRDAINDAIRSHIPKSYLVIDKDIMLSHMKEKGISLDSLVGKTGQEITALAFERGVAGVVEKKPEFVEE